MSLPLFSGALSTETDSSKAERAALAKLEAGLGGRTPDLVAVFATHHHGETLEEIGPRLCRATGAQTVIGCTAESVIGGDHEVEGHAGLSLWAASLPDTRVTFFETTARSGPDEEPVFSGLPPVTDAEQASLIVLADSYSFPIDPFLVEINENLAGVPAMGGIASGAMGPGQTLLITADGVREEGAIGIVLEGGIELRPVVSQGCRPVGKPWVITSCERNLIQKLGGRPALEVLMETWHGLSPPDQKLMQSAPFVGLAIDASRKQFQRGDFLVRGIMGLHQKERAIAVADFVRRGQTIQLLVRDSSSAGEDLKFLMATQGGGALTSPDSGPQAGALLFSCNGRGTRMFGDPHHDIRCVRSELDADVPVSGFFAAGEIGPVGGRNFLHGFTASVAVFRPRTTQS